MHGDHTGGNAAFAKDGATLVSHINVRNRIAAGTASNLTGTKNPPVPPEVLPTKTYESGSITIEVKGRTAKLTHPLNAHTDGDTYNGGSLKGMVAANDAFLTIVNDDTKIVPGHGPLANKQQLKDFRGMVVTSLTRMEKLVADGKVKSEADALAAKPFADLDAKWAANEQAANNWIRIVYHSVVQ